jgi:hypothetical protein
VGWGGVNCPNSNGDCYIKKIRFFGKLGDRLDYPNPEAIKPLPDVVTLPKIRRTMAIGFRNDEIRRVIAIRIEISTFKSYETHYWSSFSLFPFPSSGVPCA